VSISSPSLKITPVALAAAGTQTITSWTPSPGVAYGLYVCGGRTTNDAVQPNSVVGNGITWGFVTTQPAASGNLQAALYVGSTMSPVSEGTVISYTVAHALHAWVVELLGVDTASAVRQSNGATTTSTSASVGLASAPNSDSMTMIFVASNSISQTLSSSVDTDMGSQATGSSPSLRTAVGYALPGVQTNTYTASGTASKALIAAEFNAGAGSLGSWAYGKEVRIG
jgi:hypothetical protein